MAKVGIKRATELTGKSKSTIQRAMKDGKLSYDMDGKRKVIDVSELDRVYGITTNMNDDTNNASKITTSSYEIELQKAKHTLELDRLEMQVKMLEDKLDIANDQIDDLKAQRDSWQKQAQQVLLTSEHSQKQADDRIADLQKREDARAKAMQAKREQELQRQKQRAIAASNQNTNNNKNSLLKALFTKQKKAS